MEDYLSWVGPHPGAGEESEKEEGAEKTCGEPTAIPIPCPPVPLGGRRRRKSTVKSSSGRSKERGEGVLKIWLDFSLSNSNLIGDKLISPSSICFVHDGNW